MKIKREPICAKYWLNKFGAEDKSLEYWNKIFTFKIKNRIENKFGHFQYNLLYDLILSHAPEFNLFYHVKND